MKNNEAAKKSRAQRKRREQENVNENSILKSRLRELEMQNKQLMQEMENMQKTIKDMAVERESLKRQLGSYEFPGQQVDHSKFLTPLTDLTNQQPLGFPSYQNI
uniref:BZIP domain-containing protein n=1 Tax=Caenorhabditis japonica TaxID=281687 RepID=A0A8R1HUI7_CAEJA